MLLRTLGGLRLEGADFSRPKPLLLLAYLAVEGPKDRRYLSGLFWPGATAPMTNLRTALSQLRRGAPGAIHDDESRLATGVRLDVKGLLDGETIDRDAMVQSVYPGPFLEGLHVPDLGVELEEWVYATRELVAETVRAHLLTVAEEQARRGQPKLAVRQAEAAWRLPGAPECTPETLERLYRLLHAGGSAHANQIRAQALEYGIEFDTGVADATPLPDVRAPNNLGHRSTSFEGRDPELLELSKLFDDPGVRLVTLVGPGGSGKTSLAQMAANNELTTGSFPGGVYFVALEEAWGEQALLSEIASVLGVTDDDDPQAAVQAAIGDRQVLLLLDNCEHLTGEMRPVADLLSACGNLTVLATSRERLRVPGEQLFPVDGLPFPDGEGPMTSETRFLDSLRLFEKRAKRVDLSFALDERTLPHVAGICRAVLGSPLAIELAAALIGVLTPKEIADELARDNDLLSAPTLRVPDRHKSLRATFEHSWRLLSQGERQALAALAVFAGGFSRDAAARVAGLTIAMLSSLIDKSLVRSLSPGRFGCHPLIRRFALEKLEQEPDRAAQVRHAHARYLIELGRAPSPAASPADVERIYAEHENYRAALTRALDDERWGTALELVAVVWPVWHAKGEWRDVRRWLERVVQRYEEFSSRDWNQDEMDPRTARTLSEALRGIGILAAAQGDLEVAQRRTAESLELSVRLADEGRAGSLTNHLGVIALHRGDFEMAEAKFLAALEVRRRINDRSGAAATLNNLGALAGRSGDLESAETYYAESLSLYRELEMPTAIALVLSNLGDVAEARGDMVRGRELYEESMALNEANGNRVGMAACSARLAAVARRHGDLGKAAELCLEALGTFHDLDDVEGVAECLNEMGMVFLGEDRPEAAATAWGAMCSLLEAAGTPLTQIQAREHERAVGLARAALKPDVFERAWARGGSLKFEETIGFARDAARIAGAGQRRR